VALITDLAGQTIVGHIRRMWLLAFPQLTASRARRVRPTWPNPWSRPS